MSESKKYNVIYADPPWQYDQSHRMFSPRNNNGRLGQKTSALDKYQTMETGDISDLPINTITQANALCFIWTTTPHMPDGIKLLSDWGFTYKTLIVWEKEGLLGMGNWVRIQTEFILIGVKGKVTPFHHQEKNIYRHKIGKHSQKPHFFRRLVETLSAKSFTKPERLELFARTREGMFGDMEYEGWDVYGNQVNASIELL